MTRKSQTRPASPRTSREIERSRARGTGDDDEGRPNDLGATDDVEREAPTHQPDKNVESGRTASRPRHQRTHR
jgi:hypothetical protein